MPTLKDAVISTPILASTTNGMEAYEGTTSNIVDLFYTIGSARNRIAKAITLFYKAFGENKDLALKTLFWARDIRGGAGEREVFRRVLQSLEKTHPQDLSKVLEHVPEYGRWDDLLIFQSASITTQCAGLIKKALSANNGLCAKWMPRQGPQANKLAKNTGMAPSVWRKTLVRLTTVVESKMCDNEWDSINFAHVPSIAAARYQKAFRSHAPIAYEAYKNALSDGTAKVNANAIFPHEVIRSLDAGDVSVASAQWSALPNYLGNSRVLPMIDVSASMNCPLGTVNPSAFKCMDISIALGLYIADKQQGAFKDMFLTFSTTPSLDVLTGDLASKVQQLKHAHWGGSTDILKAFELTLEYAVTNAIPAQEMPDYILILSDMQFDAADSLLVRRLRQSGKQRNKQKHVPATGLDLIKHRFEECGYLTPKLVFWNLNAAYGNAPALSSDKGVVLISGYSPAIMKLVLKASSFNPLDLVLDTIMAPRYARISI